MFATEDSRSPFQTNKARLGWVALDFMTTRCVREAGDGCVSVREAGGGCMSVREAGGGCMSVREAGGGCMSVREAGGGWMLRFPGSGSIKNIHNIDLSI